MSLPWLSGGYQETGLVPTLKLTKRAIDGIKPEAKRTFWFDTDVKGFGLKARWTGRAESAGDAWQVRCADDV